MRLSLQWAGALKARLGAFWRKRSFAGRVLLVALAIAVLCGCLVPTPQTAVLMAGGFALLGLLLLLRARAGKLPGFSLRVHKGLVVSVTTLWLGLVLTEMVLRVVFFPMFPDLGRLRQFGQDLHYQYDSTLGWFPIPNSRCTFTVFGPEAAHTYTISIAHNSLGLRDPEPALDDRPGIVFLGDSFVWGYIVQAPEVFTAKVRDRHPEWRVFNLGVCGYATDQEFLMLQRFIKKLHPRLVFLVFCTGNDDDDNRSNMYSEWYYKPYFVPGPNGLELRGVPVPLSERVFYLRHPVLSKPYFVRLAVRAWRSLLHPHPHWQTSPTPAILQALRQYVESQGAAFCVGFTDRSPKLEQFLDAAKIPWLDLSTKLRIPGDPHWSPEGHTFVAGKIEEFLKARNLVNGR